MLVLGAFPSQSVSTYLSAWLKYPRFHFPAFPLSRFFPLSHLTTHHSMRNCLCRSDLLVRARMAYAIWRPVRQCAFGGGATFPPKL
jgi:hypothetical protein